MPTTLNSFILSGGINDNVKKVLTASPIDKEVKQGSVIADLEGDFKKDVLFPFIMARYLIFITDILAVCDLRFTWSWISYFNS